MPIGGFMNFSELLEKIEQIRLSIPMSQTEVAQEMDIGISSWLRIKKNSNASARIIRSMKEFIKKYEGK